MPNDESADDTAILQDAEALSRLIAEYGGVAQPPTLRWELEGSVHADDYLVHSGQTVNVFSPPRRIPLTDIGSRDPIEEPDVRRFKCRKLSLELRVILWTHYEDAINTLCVHYRQVIRTFNVWEKE